MVRAGLALCALCEMPGVSQVVAKRPGADSGAAPAVLASQVALDWVRHGSLPVDDLAQLRADFFAEIEMACSAAGRGATGLDDTAKAL